MSDTMLPARTRSDIELAIGVEPIEDVQRNRRTAMEQLAPLEAKYGPGGTHDAIRKQYRAAIATEIGLALETKRGKQPSEAELERLAGADPRYAGFLANAEREIAAYHLLKLRVTECTEIINRDQALVRYAANEPK
jgi:hypothetical protein